MVGPRWGCRPLLRLWLALAVAPIVVVGGSGRYEALVAKTFGPCLADSWMAAKRVRGYILHVWRVDEVRSCLGTLKISLHDMSVTMDNLFLGVANVYSFTPIVANTTASVQRTTCDLEVHKLELDLEGALHEVYVRFVARAAADRRLEDIAVALEQATGDSDGQGGGLLTPAEARAAESLAVALEAPTQIGALEFHSTLNKLFSRLQDAHTQYVFVSGILQVLPVEFSLRPSADGSGARVLASHASATAAVLGLDGRSSRLLENKSAEREVASINGQEPLAFLQRIADRLGTYLDAGARLNAVLMHAPLAQVTAEMSNGVVCIVAAMCDLAPPGETSVRFTFTDGSVEVVDVVIALDPALTIANHVKAGPQFEFLDAQLHRKEEWLEKRLEACNKLPDCDPSAFSTLGDHGGGGAYRRLAPRLPARVLDAAAARLSARRAARGEDEDSKEAARVGSPSADESHIGSDKLRRLQFGLDTKIGLEPLGMELREDDTPGRRKVRGTDVGDSGKAERCLEAASREASSLHNGSGSKFPESSGSNGTTPKVVYVAVNHWGEDWITVLHAGDMMVLKLQSMGGDPVMSYFTSFMNAWRELVNYAREHGIRRLLLDLVSNLGGLVALSDLMQSLILKDYNPRSLCNYYDERVNDYWRAWIISYGAGIDQSIVDHLYVLEMYSRVKSFETAKLYAYSQVLGHAFGCKSTELDCCVDGTVAWRCRGDVIVDLQKISYWVDKVNRSTTKAELLKIMRETLPKHEFIPRCLFGGSMVYDVRGSGKSAPEGWFPFTGDDLLRPDTLKPWRKMRGILDGVRQHWGGHVVNLTQRGIFKSCPRVVANTQNLKELSRLGLPDLTDVVDHPFTDVAVLTDGLAGSAASAVASRLLSSKRVAVFTFGGLADGSPMDSSAYAGGNVLNYFEWWPRVALAAELGTWLLPNQPWEVLSRNFSLYHRNGFNYRHYMKMVTYPFAMPLNQANARFNFNMMYISEFGVKGDPSMLPRQFYRLPAHRQYKRWPKRLQTVCGNTRELLDLYWTIHGENWFELRRHPQFLGKGWSSACIPDLTERECCEVVENAPPEDDSEPRGLYWLYVLLSIAGGLVLMFVVLRVVHALLIASGKRAAKRQEMPKVVPQLTRAFTETFGSSSRSRRRANTGQPSAHSDPGIVEATREASGTLSPVHSSSDEEGCEREDSMRMGPHPTTASHPPPRGSYRGVIVV
eukprot:TRINITY_DN28053_c0_g2_i1.p1 TRINITY_DN28053_c0_g2~~TRINITY_DN28053_c0_g2_i1.p1  ORF type:complete len:1210 (-),score=235.56 TRINITY_DN28053_c0_g2_i1:226-3855(-)